MRLRISSQGRSYLPVHLRHLSPHRIVPVFRVLRWCGWVVILPVISVSPLSRGTCWNQRSQNDRPPPFPPTPPLNALYVPTASTLMRPRYPSIFSSIILLSRSVNPRRQLYLSCGARQRYCKKRRDRNSYGQGFRTPFLGFAGVSPHIP